VASGHWVIHLVDDKRMIQYHQQTMNLATTTDVLTFNYTPSDLQAAPLDLETIICVDEAQRQAAIRDHQSTELEIMLYAIHSLLHCVGYDDLIPRQARIMHRKEDSILLQMGLPAVYHTAPLTPAATGNADTGNRASKRIASPNLSPSRRKTPTRARGGRR
jgi:probable rRNA maturation factor